MNTNCLEGMRCPNCGSYGEFRVQSRCWMNWGDDGTGDYCEPEFGNDDKCLCLSCKYLGVVRDFEDVDNDGRFKDCADCGQTNNIDNMRLVDGSNIKGVWLCDNCWDDRLRDTE